jgi:hypothetical protein
MLSTHLRGKRRTKSLWKNDMTSDKMPNHAPPGLAPPAKIGAHLRRFTAASGGARNLMRNAAEKRTPQPPFLTETI